MNPDNPYAALQTIEPQTAAQLRPMAVLAGRQLFPVLDTGVLLRLEKMSRDLEWATLFWFFPLLGSACAAIGTLVFGRLSWVEGLAFAAVFGVSAWRRQIGAARRSADRIIIRCLDGLVFLAILAMMAIVIVSFCWQPALKFVWGAFLLGLLATIFGNSILATFSGQALFGRTPFVHQELVAEAEHRRAQKID